MSIKKLQKITKITPLSNPVANKIKGLLGFSGFFSNSKRVRFLQGKQSVASPKKKQEKTWQNKKYTITANINKNIEKKIQLARLTFHFCRHKVDFTLSLASYWLALVSYRYSNKFAQWTKAASSVEVVSYRTNIVKNHLTG